MFVDPHVGESIELNNKIYKFVEAANAPGILYAEIGRKAKVYQLSSDGHLFALKAFKPRYRSAANIEQTEQIAKYSNIAGLAVTNRLVISPETHPRIIEQNNAFSYSILMPWIEGKSWFNFVTGRVPVSVPDSKRLAKAFINAVFELEKHGLAHCDLSSSNFVFSPDFNHVELIDIEDMFGHGLLPPKENPKGTGGYAPDWVKIDGIWEAGADRFSSSILVSEILGWEFEDIRGASSGDAYFADGEFGHKSKRFRLLSERLEQIHPELSNLFKTAWYAESLEECPKIADWKQVLDSIHEPIMEVSPSYLHFGVLDLSGKPPTQPKVRIKIRNLGGGVLTGQITSQVPWLTVSPVEFSCSEGKSSEHAVTLGKNAPTSKKQTEYAFKSGVSLLANYTTTSLDGKYSVQHPKSFVAGWVIGLAIIFLMAIVYFSRSGSNSTPPPFVTDTKVSTYTYTPAPTSSKTPTPKPTKTPTPTFTFVPQSNILFQEDFEDNQISHEWTTLWDIESDKNNNHYWVATGTYHPYPSAWLSRENKESWENYSVETRVYIVNGGLFLNIRDSGDSSSQRYTAWISEKDDWASMAQYSYPPSSFDEIDGAGKNIRIDTNTWYTVRLEVTDAHLAFYINNKLISRSNLPQPIASTYGSIGFYVTSGDRVYLDDIRVWSLTEQDYSQSPDSASKEPVAKLLGDELIEPCAWAVKIYLGGFKPKSTISVASRYKELVCSDGKVVSSTWTSNYNQNTDANGNLVITYLHKGTGDYNYTFTDEDGNQATLTFSTVP